MLDLDLMNEAQSHKNFIRLPISITGLLGHKAAVLLEHLRYVLQDKNFMVEKDENGVLWYKQNNSWLTYYTALSVKEFRTAKQKLLDLRLICIKQKNGLDRTLSWRIDEEVYKRFCGFAYALFCAVAPINDKTIHIWWNFKLVHPDIVGEFQHLYPNLEKFDPPADYIPQDIENSSGLLGAGHMHNVGDNDEKTRKPVFALTAKKVKENLPTKSKKPGVGAVPDKFVEFWNKQPNVPKCRIGTKAYEMCRQFFRAFQRYQAGTELFPLDSAEQQRIQLKVINRSARHAPKCGPKQIPMRPDSEMFELIGIAARIYQPDYAPMDKKWLPKTLAHFLYNDHSKRYGRLSLFLEKLCAFPPLTVDEDTYESLWDKADEDTQGIYSLFQGWYNIANGRDPDAGFSLKDHKRLLSMAKDWRDYFYEKLSGEYMPDGVAMTYFSDFIGYIRFVTQDDLIRDDLPLGTFKKCGQFWKQILGEESCMDD